MATDTVNADTRYSFPLQFLRSSAVFARQSAEIEKSGLNFESIADDDRTKYLGFVTAAVMQCVAAVESESAELTLHGPGAHLGSGPGWNLQDRDLLKPHAEEIDHQEALDRFNSILNILCKPQLDAGAPPWQDMAVLVKVRNRLIHYKSKWGKEMDEEKFFAKVLPQLAKTRSISKPPFVKTDQNFFPHRFLSAACAAWSVRTTVSFINTLYEKLSVESRLKPYMSDFADFMVPSKGAKKGK